MYSKETQLKKNSPKKYKEKKCKVCHKFFTPDRAYQKVCSTECAIEYSLQEKDRQKKYEIRKAKKELKDNNKRDLTKKAQKIFNEFIRLRDKGQPCISCGHVGGRQVHAGHYMSVGGNASLRFNEDNCHAQCSICNNYKSGNLANYRENLIRKIGLKKVEELEQKKVHKFSVEELKEIIMIYRGKVKELNKK